jgi:hypothetical protein
MAGFLSERFMDNTQSNSMNEDEWSFLSDFYNHPDRTYGNV